MERSQKADKALLRQMVLGLVLVYHSSFRGVVEFLKGVLDGPLSLGSVANIVRSAVARFLGAPTLRAADFPLTLPVCFRLP